MEALRRSLWSRVGVRVLFYGAAAGIGLYLWRGGPSARVQSPVGPAQSPAGTAQSTAAAGPRTVASRARPARPSLLEVPPAEMREVLHSAYRLKPDGRCVGAFVEVHAWISGTPAQASVAFVGDHWRIDVGGEHAAVLPELPDFDDCMAALVDWASLLGSASGLEPRLDPARRRLPPPGPQSLDTADLLAGLRELDRKKPQRSADPDLLLAATRSFVFLTFETLDLMETSDRLAARAWAFLALSSAFTDYDVGRERALLASSLDYSEAAARQAVALPKSDPVRLFLLHDDAGLRRLAGGPRAGQLESLLLLFNLTERGDYPGWLKWVSLRYPSRAFSIPVLQSALRMNAFLPNRVLPALIPYVILSNVLSETADAGWLTQVHQLDAYTGTNDSVALMAAAIGKVLKIRSNDLVRVFDRRIGEAKERYPGPLLDHDLYRKLYEALFYSALYRSAQFNLDQLASIDAAQSFLEELSGATSPSAVGFAQWYGHLIEAQSGRAQPAVLADDLAAPYPFGAEPRFRTFKSLERWIGQGKPERFAAMRRLVPEMDSRPAHAHWLAWHAWSDLYDLNLSEELFRYLQRVAERRLPYDADWSAAFLGDTHRLEAYLADPSFPPDAKRSVVNHLAHDRTLDPPAVEAAYRKLGVESPDSWALANDFAEYLERRKDYAGARRVMSAWLGRKVADPGLEQIIATSTVARTYYEEGAYRDAWRTIEPVVSSWQGGAMERAAMTLARMGDVAHARELFVAVTDRYPDSLKSRVRYAQFLWEQGLDDEAARGLREFKGHLDGWTWRDEIAPVFHATFASLPDDRTLAAFEQIKRAGFPQGEIRFLADPFARQGRYELAFHMISDLRENSLVQVEILITAYHFLAHWKGEPEAIDWLKNRIPPPMRNPASMVFLTRGEDDLLWEVVERPEEGSHPEWVWVGRAISVARGSSREPERRAAVERYFAVPRDDATDALANFLLGKAPEEAVWRRATDPRRRGEGAYVVGLKRLCEGDYRAASDWFRVVQEVANENMGEYHWASDTLRSWKERAQSLDRIAPACRAQEEPAEVEPEAPQSARR